MNNSFELIQRHHGTKSGRTSVDNDFGIEAHNSGQAVYKPAQEDILTNSKEDGTTKLLHKEHQGQTERDASARQNVLGGQIRSLEATANTETIKNLIANSGVVP